MNAAAESPRVSKVYRLAQVSIAQPSKFELVIKLKTAKQIGVTLPQSVLFRANRVIR